MRFFAVLLMIAGVMMTGCQCTAPCRSNLPPANMMMHPGPGVDGPGPGVAMYQSGGPSTGHDLANPFRWTRWHDHQLGRQRAGRVRLGSRSLSGRITISRKATFIG